MSKYVEVDIEAHVGTVRLARPEVHNAFDDQMISDLAASFVALGRREDVRVVVLRGQGKSFSAGADLNWMQRMVDYSEKENQADAEALADMLLGIRHCPKPVIACVHGAAIGGGTGLVAAADIALAAPAARFAFSEVRLGLIPAVISPFVIERIGLTAARRYMLTAERFDAEEALRIGLIAELCVDEAALNRRTEAYCACFAENGPAAVAACKKLLNDVGATRPEDVSGETSRRIAALRVSSEGQEGLQAFLEKRKPSWSQAEG